MVYCAYVKKNVFYKSGFVEVINCMNDNRLSLQFVFKVLLRLGFSTGKINMTESVMRN